MHLSEQKGKAFVKAKHPKGLVSKETMAEIKSESKLIAARREWNSVQQFTYESEQISAAAMETAGIKGNHINGSGKALCEKELKEILIKHNRPTFPRPPGIPEDWIPSISKKGGGMIYTKPGTNGATSVRVMPARPHGPPGEQVPYVVQKVNGRVLDKAGVPLKDPKSKAGHIPLNEFKFKK